MAVDGIIGIKLGMTQIFAEDGALVGCTVLQAGPCVVVQRRTKEKDGYEAAQLGLVEFFCLATAQFRVEMFNALNRANFSTPWV